MMLPEPEVIVSVSPAPLTWPRREISPLPVWLSSVVLAEVSVTAPV
jgi:hypothetical protein